MSTTCVWPTPSTLLMVRVVFLHRSFDLPFTLFLSSPPYLLSPLFSLSPPHSHHLCSSLPHVPISSVMSLSLHSSPSPLSSPSLPLPHPHILPSPPPLSPSQSPSRLRSCGPAATPASWTDWRGSNPAPTFPTRPSSMVTWVASCGLVQRLMGLRWERKGGEESSALRRSCTMARLPSFTSRGSR